MGIRFLCPNGHKLNVKAFLAGRRGICPFCGSKFQIPTESTLQLGQSSPTDNSPVVADAPTASLNSGAAAFEQNLEAHVQQAEQAASDRSPDASPAAWSGSTAPTESPPVRPEQDGQPAPIGVADHETGSPESIAVADSPHPAEEQPAAAPIATDPSQTPSAADPLTETPNAMWYVRPPSGGQFGPAQADMMRGWLTEGRVSPETLVWREGWADWQEAGSVFPELQSTSALPAAPPVAVGGAGDGTSSFRTGLRRRKSGPSRGLIVVLAAVVLLLLVALIWILTGGMKGNSPEQGSSEAALVKHHSAPRMTQPG